MNRLMYKLCMLYAMVRFYHQKAVKCMWWFQERGKNTIERISCYICSNEIFCCSYLRTAVKVSLKVGFFLKQALVLIEGMKVKKKSLFCGRQDTNSPIILSLRSQKTVFKQHKLVVCHHVYMFDILLMLYMVQLQFTCLAMACILKLQF